MEASLPARVRPVAALLPAPLTPVRLRSSATVLGLALRFIATTTGLLPDGAVRSQASTSSSSLFSMTMPPLCSAGLERRSAINVLYQFSSELGSPLSVSTLTVL